MSKKVKIYAPVFDMPKSILDMGRFNIRFLTIDLIDKDGVTIDIQAADIPSGVILRIIDWNNMNSEEAEVLNISYQFIPGVHVVTSKETGNGFFLYDEARGNESIAGLVGDEKLTPIAPNAHIDNDGNVIMDCEDEDNPDLEEILSDDDDDVETCKKEDKPHKTFVADRNEQAKKEVQKSKETVEHHMKPLAMMTAARVADSAKHMLPTSVPDRNNQKDLKITPVSQKPKQQKQTQDNHKTEVNFASIVRRAFPSK